MMTFYHGSGGGARTYGEKQKRKGTGMAPRAFFTRDGHSPARHLKTAPRYFFLTYFRQSIVTAARMITPEQTNCRFVSTPRIVSE